MFGSLTDKLPWKWIQNLVPLTVKALLQTQFLLAFISVGMQTKHWLILCQMTSTHGQVLILEIWNKSPEADIDMHLALPQACWDWRNWSDAFSSPGRRCRSGCWMTTWTLRRCWRRSAMTKWLPSSLMPMLLSLISSSRRSTFKHWYIFRAAHMCTVTYKFFYKLLL